MKERCEFCRYWLHLADDYGFCRRYAPKPMTIVDAEKDFATVVWPYVAEYDYCGEYKNDND